MKLSDYIAQFLAANGVRHVFGLQGGAVVHLFDSIETVDNIAAVYCHHEQAAALAATSNAKVTGQVGAGVFTTGPGSTNAITGLLAAWQDSIPVIFISGQTRVEHTSYGKPVRQVGSQEFNILDVVRPITKYAELVRSPNDIENILHQAYTHAVTGRKGPVWIDVPVNLQWEDVEVTRPLKVDVLDAALPDTATDFAPLVQMMKAAQRPVVVAGYGIRGAGCQEQFLSFVKASGIPFVTTWTASDLTATDNPSNGGIIGVTGQRGANKILYHADLIVCLGSHLSATQTSTQFADFAPNAKKAIVDFDRGELDNLNIQFDLAIHADIREFFEFYGKSAFQAAPHPDWKVEFADLKRQNSVVETLLDKSSIGDDHSVNSNYFNYMLTREMPKDSVLVVDGGGTALYTGFQASSLKEGQRIICSSSISAMGTGLPESIGVSFAMADPSVYCVIGDGSMMLNLQELQTIRFHNLPIKIVVYNNSGYLAIKHTQGSFLGGRFYGTDSCNGLSFPSFQRVAECFQIDYLRVDNVANVEAAVAQIKGHHGPMIVEVIVPADQRMLFQQGYREVSPGRYQPMALYEMAPYV